MPPKQATEQQEKPATEKKPVSIEDKIEKARKVWENLIIERDEKVSKTDNGRILGAIVKTSIKAKESGKKEVDWKEFGDEIALFSRTDGKDLEGCKKLLVKMSIHYLTLALLKEAEEKTGESVNPSSASIDSETEGQSEQEETES